LQFHAKKATRSLLPIAIAEEKVAIALRSSFVIASVRLKT
jgi:hypothetical protein